MSDVSSRRTVTSFIPRQVMLEMATNATAAASKDDDFKKKKKRKDEIVTVMEIENEGKKSKKKKSSKISNGGGHVSDLIETPALDRPSGDAISLKGKGRESLLRSIAAFLESSGFAKTLSVFRLEAQIEVNNTGVSCFNLEDSCDKLIELSNIYPIASVDWSKEQEENTDHEKPSKVEKKNKHKVMLEECMGEVACINCEVVAKEKIEESNGLTSKPNAAASDIEKGKGEKKKKEAKQLLEQSELGVNQKESTKKSNDEAAYASTEKKKKHKVIPGESMGEVARTNFEVVAKEKIEESKDLTSKPNVATGDFEKDKGEKKKKKEAKKLQEQSELCVNQKVITKKSDDEAAYASTKHQESVNSDNLVIDLQENADRSRKDEKKGKSKKLENTSDVETTTNKKRKRSSSNERALDVAEEEKETCDHKALTCSEPSQLNQEFKEPAKILSSVVLDKLEENANLQNPQKKLSENQLANGGIDEHQKEGSSVRKSMKKEKHFDEPKALNAFQRVKVDEVQFANERLQDNSYWALDDSGSGYGAKAQEVLGQVKGRDFRHEKTKKKRGSYRGGQIDLQSHSIKFNYSDNE
ncbi:lisH domain-containing protein C1711.05 isoform X6 [Phalaenopsis equestris]|uniref:lisH domain-containing protein C1711.05 isoform X6 n=1 Tax=Phalaenopsis equestris TaxID=78828 RepID=UPI0009E3E66B|nr:lisH domain-containing protein C1711.05 isoform X6 [Phalaenopsis equestris]